MRNIFFPHYLSGEPFYMAVCCIYNSTWRGLAALLILELRQCEGLRAGMDEK